MDAGQAHAAAAFRGAHQHHLVRAGQPKSQPLPPGQQVGHGAPAGQQVLEELAALRLLPAGDRQVGPLEPARGRRHRVVRGVQHGQHGGPQHHRRVAAGGQFAPQPPGRRQVQVDQAAQGNPALRGLLPGPGVPGKFRGGQAAPAAKRLKHSGQVVAEQPGRDTAGLAARGASDRRQVRPAAVCSHSRHRLPAGHACPRPAMACSGLRSRRLHILPETGNISG